MSDTLNYADQSLRRKIPTRWAWVILTAAILLGVAVPAGGVFLRFYYFGRSSGWFSDSAIVVTLIGACAMMRG